MPHKSVQYLQRELDFYQLPSLDELNQCFNSDDKSFWTKAKSKELMQDIVDEIKESGLEHMLPWCVYIYNQVPRKAGKMQRRILVLPDVVRANYFYVESSYIKDRNHEEFVKMMKDSKLCVTPKELYPYWYTSETVFALQPPTDDLVKPLKREAQSLGLSIEARNLKSVKDETKSRRVDLEDLPFLHCYLL